MDSGRERFWTLDRAKGAVKAAFFSRSVIAPEGPGSVWLRFTQIREAVSANEGRIGDRTLSRTLKSLVSEGQLRRRQQGRATLYCLETSRSALVQAFAQAEGAAVQVAGSVGGWGDGLEGWVVFGVPEVLPRRYRARLRSECLRHQQTLREVLDDVFEEYIDSVLHPARSRVSRSIYRAGQKGLADLLELQVRGIMGVAYSSRIWQMVEETVPGTLSAFQKTVLPSGHQQVPIGEGLSMVTSKLTGVPVETIRPRVERELARLQRRVERYAASVKPLWDRLTKSEQDRASRRLQAASTMAGLLTSVVHT